MRGKPLFWQIYPSYVLIILLALVAVSGLYSDSLRDFYLDQVGSDLEARGRLFEGQAASLLTSSGAEEELDRLCKTFGRATATRFTVVALSGEVIGDSVEDPRRMENHARRTEIAAALRGEVARSIRGSRTLQESMMYVALPALSGQRVVGVVRAARALNAIDLALKGVYREVAWGGLAVAVVAALVGFFLSRRLSRPLEAMKQGAELFAQGHFDRKLPAAGSRESRALADAMNLMAGQLDERIRTIIRQRNEQQAVFTSMVEGVVALDNEERVLHINRAAADLLAVSPESVEGRRLQEIVRKADLQRFMTRALASGTPLEGEVVLPGEAGDRFLQAHGTVLRGGDGRSIGVLIVLNDVTRLRRLENIRRDFVANVSHELKTPITGIKGSVETLLDGALAHPEDAMRFLGIIAKQAERLNAIIDDLLELSRVEQGQGDHAIALQTAPLAPVLRTARHACEMTAREKGIELVLAWEEELSASVNPPLLEQAVVNLIDNAVKYSGPDSEVRIEARRIGREVVILVRDQGCGIEREHLSRLFERFYRVDKARSRRAGGTGLGLSIVKHIVQAHHGRVTVESVPGRGSTFAIYLPQV
jgi:two-component system phosphate regulon sensor histidine kinase PhoR